MDLRPGGCVPVQPFTGGCVPVQPFTQARRMLCLICRRHRSQRRRLCSLCGQRRALPSCWPEHCWVPYFRACRPCVLWLLRDEGLGDAALSGPGDLILDFLFE